MAAFSARFDRYGLDRSIRAIEFASERLTGVHFELAQLPRSGGNKIAGADLVFLCDVLEHIEGDAACLHWLVSAMKPGAHLLMTVPADPRLWSPHDEVYGHCRRYAKESLTGLWADPPVNVRLSAPFNRILFPRRGSPALPCAAGRRGGTRNAALWCYRGRR